MAVAMNPKIIVVTVMWNLICLAARKRHNQVKEMVNKLKNVAVYKDEQFIKHVQYIESLT